MATLEEIKKKQEELDHLIKSYEKENEKRMKKTTSSVWIPKVNETYYFIDVDGDINHTLWDGYRNDMEVLEMNNVFETQEEAEDQMEWLTILYRLRTLGGDYWHNVKEGTRGVCTIAYDYESKAVCVDTKFDIQITPLPVYFKTKEQVEYAIKTIGEDRLRTSWFRVEV